MPKTYSKQVKKGKFKMALFFLVVTCFIWFLSKFSKDFTATVEASIHYKNLPNNTVLASNNIETVSFDLTSSGFDFLSYKFKKPIITINVTEYFIEEKKTIQITNNELIKIITSELKSNIAVKNVSVNEINLTIDIIVSKEIPIKIVADITFQNGFKAVNKLLINPSSIIVSGPSEVIDSIEYLVTEIIKLELLNRAISGEIEIVNSNNLNISFSKKKVSYSIKVEEFTQKELLIPIKIENLPIGTSVKLIPEIISIVFDISVSKFNTITENDFTVICDYNKRNKEDNFMIPRLVKKPSLIQNILLQNTKIEYLIFK